MKTSKVIGLLCTAISGLNDTLTLVNAFPIEDGKIMHPDNERTMRDDFTHVHSMLSPCSELTRTLWDELPESLRDEESNKLVTKLYPHLFEDNYVEMQQQVRDAHTAIYAIWQEMRDALDAAELYE